MPRLLVEGGVYHVYNRTARGERLFQDEREARRFLRLACEVKERDELVVLGWALLSNHYHLAVRTGPVSLSRSMRSIQGRFSQAFNIRHERTGAVWQSRFQSRLVGENEYLRRLILYVHANPVRAGLAEDPNRYRWCGHAEMIGRRKAELLDVDDALLVFGETLRTARRGYLESMRATVRVEGPERGLLEAPWWLREAELKVREDVNHVDQLGRSTGPERPELEAEEYVELCCELLDAQLADLQGRERGEVRTRTRELIAGVGLQRWGQKTKSLASVLQMHPDSVSRLATRAAQRAREDDGFRAREKELDRGLVIRARDRD